MRRRPPSSGRPGRASRTTGCPRAIAREFGGTPERWAELIRSGKLDGTSHGKGPGSKVRRKLVLAYVALAVARSLAEDAPPLPEIVLRNRVAYIKGTGVRVRLLERAWRAGSTEADLRAAFPELPPRALDAVAAFARRSPADTPGLKALVAPAEPPPGEEEDDGDGFDEELEALIGERAGLFRRLAW